jgi:opacity protein-like surface antigen
MSRLALSAAALFLAGAMPLCAAQTAGTPRWYVTGSLGSSLIGDPSVTYTPPAGPPGSGKFKLGNGLMTGGTLGWNLAPDWRIEADYNYRTNKLSSTSVPGLDAAQSDADYASVLIMANLLKDFDGWTTGFATFRPYLGAGLGIAQEVDTDLKIGGVEREFSGNRFAWQLLAGVNWQYRSPWFAGLGLRYVDAGSLRLDSSPPGLGEIKADYRGFGLELRLGYRF